MKRPTYFDMATAVCRLAAEHQQLIAAVDRGEAIIPSARDIKAGGVDYRWQTRCIEAASGELMATARLLASNAESILRRKVG